MNTGQFLKRLGVTARTAIAAARRAWRLAAEQEAAATRLIWKRQYRGWVAEIAVWNSVILTDAEAQRLAAGHSPLTVRPDKLVYYSPRHAGVTMPTDTQWKVTENWCPGADLPGQSPEPLC